MRAIKIRAVKENRELRDAIADLLKRGLSREPMVRATKRLRVKLPLVRCAHEAHRSEETTPQRAAEILLGEESDTTRGLVR
jgi:hypothetical protein